MPFTRLLTKSLKYATHMDACGAKWITVEDYGGLGPLLIYL
jgi:hypothetical protein